MKTKSLIIGLVVIGGITFTSCSRKENTKSKELIVTDSKNQIEDNKKLVLDFYQKMFGDKDISAVDQYIASDYIQHNPTLKDGAEALKQAAKKWFEGSQKTKIDVQHVAAEGDLVFVHLKNKKQDGTLTSTIDIFRVKDGKIVEHWDVHQDVPKDAENSHPMF